MDIEYEATFTNIDKDEVRQKLKKVGAKLIKPEFMQRRVVFNMPSGHEIKGGWLRVRDEGDKITMSLKVVDGKNIHNQKEICLEINDFNSAENFLISLGCDRKAYQESKRELWQLENVEITIDEWPYLEPFVEVEGKSEEEVKEVSQKLGLDYNKAVFGAVDVLYNMKYRTPIDIINNQTPNITFSDPNPFI